MRAINQELWVVVAADALAIVVAKMAAITNRDTRGALLQNKDFLGWLRVELAHQDSLGFAVPLSILGLLRDELQDNAFYLPAIRDQLIPFVTGGIISDNVTLSADPAPEGYDIIVFRFEDDLFVEVGTLDKNTQPGKGKYVLVMNKLDDEGDPTDDLGLPTGYLEVT